ncbi:MAG: hypothetical protein AVDCRST_MAG68-4835, partial [uncultured Gemmatimonadetes bacterium]
GRSVDGTLPRLRTRVRREREAGRQRLVREVPRAPGVPLHARGLAAHGPLRPGLLRPGGVGRAAGVALHGGMAGAGRGARLGDLQGGPPRGVRRDPLAHDAPRGGV